MTLFDLTAIPETESDPVEKLSADRRRTLKRQQMLSRGVHPTTRLPLLHEGWNRTCGDCDHHVAGDWHNRTYHKCDVVEMTHGPGTDLRVSWPACTAFRESA